MAKAELDHYTYVTERHLRGSPERVFRAWSNADDRKTWDFIGADAEVTEHEQEFRVGGRELTRFGPVGNPRFLSEGTFLEIIPNARFVEIGTFNVDDQVAAATVVTIEFLPDGEDTRLKLTDQSTFFYAPEETPQTREENWNGILDKLEAFLAAAPR